MNRVEHMLSTVAEECAEVAQRATKAQRFSLSEIQPEQRYTNAERIMHEYADLVGMIELLMSEGHLEFPVDWVERVEEKKARFEKFLKRSEESGALTK